MTLQCPGAGGGGRPAVNRYVSTTLGPVTLLLSGNASGKVTPVICPRVTSCLGLCPPAQKGRVGGGYEGAGMIKIFTPKPLGQLPKVK